MAALICGGWVSEEGEWTQRKGRALRETLYPQKSIMENNKKIILKIIIDNWQKHVTQSLYSQLM